MCRVRVLRVGFVFSPQPDSTMELGYLMLNAPLRSTSINMYVSHLRPRFSYILDHFGHARSRSRASACCG